MTQKLPTTKLGRTGLEVTRLGYGAMEIRGSRIWKGRPVSDEQAETILNAVLDEGINFIDTSNCYGTSEEFIGKYISHRRSEFHLSTKCGCLIERKDDTTDNTLHVFTRENILRGLHESLERMKTDYVDIIPLHNPKVEISEREKVVEVLQEMRDQGKARHVSISTKLPDLRTYLEWDVFDTFQIPYSALEREHEDAITASGKAGIGIIIRGGVARGEPGAGLGKEDNWKKFEDAGLDELREQGESRTSFMLRFTLTHPHANTIIVGTLQPDHLKENVQAIQRGSLASDVYEEAKRRLDAIGEKPESM